MYHRMSFTIAILVFLLSLAISKAGNAQELLVDFTIVGVWNTPALTECWCGPVVVDLENNGGPKEFIICDETQLWVFENDGELRDNFPVGIPDEDYHYRYSPAVGVVNGVDDGLGIVLCGYRFENNAPFDDHFGMLFLFDGEGEHIASSDQFHGAGIPVLADIRGSDPDANDEDGENEIIIYGGSHFRTNPTSTRWYLNCFRLQDEEFILIDSDMDQLAEAGINNVFAAIGDMNLDGKKEIVAHNGFVIKCWSFIQIDEFEERDYLELIWERDPDGNGPISGLSPILVDFYNEGELVAVTHKDNSNGEPNSYIAIYNYEGQLDEIWYADGDNPEDGFDHNAFTSDELAVGDHLNDGNITIGVPTQSGLYWRKSTNELVEGANGNNWPRDIPQGFLSNFPTLARIGTHDFDEMRLIVSNADNDHNAVAYLPTGENSDFILEIDEATNTEECCPAITDLDADGDLEICIRSFDEDLTEMFIYAYEFEDTDTENSLLNVEWSQLGNGPRHDGLYAQVYEGTLSAGAHYWRDRVIVTDDVTVWSDRDFYILDNTVVEFNEDADLYYRCGVGAWEHDFEIGENIVFKPNGDADDHFSIIWDGWQVNIPMPPTCWVGNGRIIVEDCDEITFENWTFAGATDGTGDHIAISAEDAEVNLINCTFKGYDTAVMFDNCTGTLESCTFEDANYNAVEMYDCLVGMTIEDCEFKSNDGAAIYLYNSLPDIEECNIYENDCDIYGAAIYCYNSAPHLRDNYIHDNVYSSVRAFAGSGPVMSTGSLLDPHANRTEDNNTFSHTPRADSTWAEFIQKSPSLFVIDKGHNDIMNNNGASGDYLISSWNFSIGYNFYARYNYWSTPLTLGSEDFYGNTIVDYSNPDLLPNYTCGYEEELAAHEMFMLAIQKLDSGQVADAYDDFCSIIRNYPETGTALSTLKHVHDSGLRSNVELTTLQRYFAGIAGNYNGALGVYSDRLANLCLVELERYDEAINNYEDVLADIDDHSDSLYYAIDLAYAEMAQLNDYNDEQSEAVRDARKGEVIAQRWKINYLMAELNGMPLPEYNDGVTAPSDFCILGCYPNPFNSTTTIRYKLLAAADISVNVFDLTGRQIALLHKGQTEAGEHTVSWTADDVPSGVYICRLQAGSVSNDVKMVLIQ
ncbi:right-handed parallel beta-helix repeat-containing protein [bacterium]|nr:right-handed parallel beta-helix repeat-containing protein [bacterium]